MADKLTSEEYYRAIGIDRNHMILSVLVFPYGFYKGFTLGGKKAEGARQRRIARLYKSLGFFGMMLYAFLTLLFLFKM